MENKNKPKGEPQQWLPLSLLQSPAWRKRSINCRRLLDFLAIEDASSAGRRNGKLHATYKQLNKFGIPMRKITGAILEAEALGFIEVEHGLRIGAVSRMSDFRLTYTQSYPDGKAKRPTHEWKQLSEENVSRILSELRKNKKSNSIRKAQVRSDIATQSLKTLSRFH